MKTVNNKTYKVWTFNESPEINHWGIHFTEGEFEGVVVEVLDFSSPDYKDGDTLGDLMDLNQQVNLKIEYGIVHVPDNFPLDILRTDHFKQTFDEIITEVIKDTAKGYHDQNRNIDTIELDSQRTVH